MKKYKIALFFLLIIVNSIFLNAQNKRHCSFDSLYNAKLKDASFIAAQRDFDQFLKNYRIDKNDTIIRIPLVFHVVYQNQTENISDAQIQSQLDVLNEDFNKRNTDTTNASGYSIADVKLEFCLAKRDPDGLATTGITRTATTIDNIGKTESYHVAAPIWDRNEYINVWLCDMDPENFAIGFARPPSFQDANAEGIVVDFTVFGTIGTAEAPYDKGRTLTHELGHMLNLLHPWGSSGNRCGSSDFVSDTPEQFGEIYDCPASNTSCGSLDMLSNFMQYIDDACLGNFTEGQKTRMRAALQSFRPGWSSQQECWPVGLDENSLLDKVVLAPNPNSGSFSLVFSRQMNLNQVNFTVIDLGGKEVDFQTKQRSNGFEINLLNKAQGIYLLKIETQKSSEVKKIIVKNE